MQQLTKDLIAIDSVSGNEGEIADFLSRELETRGMTVQPFCVSGKRNNLLATWDEQPPKIVFNTHMDTVPEQYGPHEDSERIYGRGACDTHGILAAQLEALQDLHEQGVKGLGILLVVGEETNHDGALHAGNCDDISAPEVLIVGEPTENTLMASQKGCLKGDLMAYGVEGHSGYPEQYDSAVEKLIFALNRLLSASWLKKDSQTGTTLNVTIKEGGKA
ncbi:M20/M25/M40 family metallo-hydrolase, partial [candidate division KSB1 bacterium]|nr:M20/M25/M40 family metallo-hydrolase [candidate division KSB1 bacterium]NIR70658.1 M20/M25/M40 family metallo-hydrolase [candidate division KSB1 bacterium]NIS23146.1 M20/M25/M40 family metallo-hydrolase [candidate division KSB1 bacterium]NIT70007.1 M20/M25/M40 family metallo-hydrolase [candidate division KSB1 bacterium]NIU23644.1 M20/M25/M40 family metallo-hydrolase [candidate division KSB1 bacterium]